MLLTSLSADGNRAVWIESPTTAFFAGIASFGALYGIIYAISRAAWNWIRKHKSLCANTVNYLLIAALIIFDFVLASPRILEAIPFSTFLTFALSFGLYFGGQFTFYAGSYYKRYLYPGSDKTTAISFATDQIMMWLPFILPLLFFSLIGDIIALLPNHNALESLTSLDGNPLHVFLFLSLALFMVAMVLIFLPYFIQKLWLCTPIEDTELWLRLTKICQQANFKYADMRIWTVMNQFHTAAIIGIIPRFRYVMFTKRLLNDLPIESIEAILVHEIGHSYRRHLLLLPFILFGMFLSAGLFFLFFSDGIYEYFVLQKIVYPSPVWDVLLPLSIFIPSALIFGLYFRFIFGFFSRQFERQADLHPFVVGTPPRQMMEALDHIGIATGHSHDHPSWHHYSLRQRINFIEKAIENPSLVEKHNRKVKRWVFTYFGVGFLMTAVLLSPALSDLPIFSKIANIIQETSNKITLFLTNKGPL